MSITRKEYMQKWREENREKVRGYYNAWAAKNPEKVKVKNAVIRKEYMQKWREENREKARSYNRKWRAENPEKAKAIHRAGMAKHRLLKPEVYNATQKRSKEKRGIIDKGFVKCVDCKKVFNKESAQLRGYKFLSGGGGTRVLCSECL